MTRSTRTCRTRRATSHLTSVRYGTTYISEERISMRHVDNPSSEHPEFKEKVTKPNRLLLTRKSASPESLKDATSIVTADLLTTERRKMKGAYGTTNPKYGVQVEVNLPVDINLGSRDHDWEIDTSKSRRTKSQHNESVQEDSLKQRRFPKKDPEYTMTAGVRANYRRSKTDNGSALEDHDRWPVCTHCKAIGAESIGWRHKASDHKCTLCGKKGHQGPYKKDGTPNKKCDLYAPRPSGGGPSPPMKPDTPKEEGDKGGTDMACTRPSSIGGLGSGRSNQSREGTNSWSEWTCLTATSTR